VLISGFADRRQILNAVAPFADLRICNSLQDLRTGIATGDITGVVCECRDSYGVPLRARLLSGSIGDKVPALIFLRPTPLDVSFFSHIVRSGLPALARVTGQADIGDVVRSVLEHNWSLEATAPIVRRIIERFAAPLDMILMIAIIAGSKRLAVNSFAQLTRMSERTLQRRLAIAGLPPASRLLSHATMLHSAWRLEVGGDRVKEVVAASGFVTREAFTSFVGRHAGCTVSHLTREGTFIQMLDDFLAELSRGIALHGGTGMATLHANAVALDAG